MIEPTWDSRLLTRSAIVLGVFGLVLALALEADVGFESGLWYPILYAGVPAIVATLIFAARRASSGQFLVAGVFLWLFVSAVGALALAVVLALGFGGDVARGPVSAMLFAGLLYLGFLLVPVGLATLAARRRGVQTAVLLVLSPIGQAVVAAVIIVPQ